MADPSHEVIAVRYGTRPARRSDVFLHYELYGEPDAEIGMDYYFWIVRDARRITLVDCGFNETSGAVRNRTMICPPAKALARFDIRPEDVDRIIVTHAHYDHIGNLNAFPRAEVVMTEREYAFWTSPMGGKPLFATSAETDDIAALTELHTTGRLRLIGRRHKEDGIELIEVGGHTPGQLIVIVDDRIVLASDALHYYEEMTLDRPFLHVADLPAMYAAFELLRELAPGRHIVAGHDPDVLRRFPAIDSDAVRITR